MASPMRCKRWRVLPVSTEMLNAPLRLAAAGEAILARLELPMPAWDKALLERWLTPAEVTGHGPSLGLDEAVQYALEASVATSQTGRTVTHNIEIQ